MKPMRKLLTGMAAFWLAAALPTGAGATSYDPLPHGEETAATGVAPGSTVHLFCGGSSQIRQAPRVGERLALASRSCSDGRSPGSIRVVGRIGKFCIRGEVLEGRVRLYDRAERDGLYFLVIPGEACPD